MEHEGEVYAVAFSPDGKYIVSGSADNTARVWHAQTGREIASMAHNGAVKSVAFSPDGNYIVSGSTDNTAQVWDISTMLTSSQSTFDNAGAQTGREVARMAHNGPVQSVAFSPDGKFVASGSWATTARAWM
jgi:WD40 repeat protein